MAGSKAPAAPRGSDKLRMSKSETVSRKPPATLYQRQGKATTKWSVSDYRPPRKISDKELDAARKMFFELDRDGSGSIDAEELGMMLRSLGQNPSDEELVELINSVDDGDKDGQMQLREFLKLYSQGLDVSTSGQAGKEEVHSVFLALGGEMVKDSKGVQTETAVGKADIKAYLLEHYDLDVDTDVLGKNDSINRDDLEAFLITND